MGLSKSVLDAKQHPQIESFLTSLKLYCEAPILLVPFLKNRSSQHKACRHSAYCCRGTWLEEHQLFRTFVGGLLHATISVLINPFVVILIVSSGFNMSITNALQHLLFKAFFSALRPLARLAYSANIDCRQFIEVTKLAFADAAISDYGIRKRPTNNSRVSLITGLTRKESKRLRDLLASGNPFAEVPTSRLNLVLQQWHTDPTFLTASGAPKALPIRGTGPSLHKLCTSSSGDCPPGALRTELLRIGAIEETPSGKFKSIRSHALNEDRVQPIVDNLQHFVTPASIAAAHNVVDAPQQPWPAAAVRFPAIATADIQAFRALTGKKTDKVCSDIESLFKSYQLVVGHDPNDHDAISAGFVIFHYEDSQPTS